MGKWKKKKKGKGIEEVGNQRLTRGKIGITKQGEKGGKEMVKK